MANSDPYLFEEMRDFNEVFLGAGARLKAAESPIECENLHEEALDDRRVKVDPYLVDALDEEDVFAGAATLESGVRFNPEAEIETMLLPILGSQLWWEGSSGTGPLGSFLSAELFASSDAFEAKANSVKKRRWSLFPLPVDTEALFSETTQQSLKDQHRRAWTNLACHGLNRMAGEKGPFPRARGSEQVKRVVGSISERVEKFFEGFDEGVEKPEIESLWQELLSKRLGYDGEEVSQPIPLSFEQIIPSVPPAGHGGSVALLPLVEGTTRWLLEHPEECLLEASLQKPGPNTAAVHISKGHEKKVWGLLQERGIVDWFPLSKIHRDDHGPFLSGIFGVPKAGRFDSAGRQILRVVMNLKPVNRILRTILGDIGDLPMAPVWAQLFLGGEEELVMSQSDIWHLPFICLPCRLVGSRCSVFRQFFLLMR